MMQKQSHVMLVEDDREIRSLVTRYLMTNGFRVTAEADGARLSRGTPPQGVDLLVLDINLPGEDGLSLCRKIRAASSVPILLLTARSSDVDRIVGLEMGADDYLTKPFNPRELLLRIKSVLRRTVREAPVVSKETLSFAGWTLSPILRQLTNPQGARVALTSAEFDLLKVLVESAGQILSRDQLLDLTQGRTAGPFDRSIDVLISRIRQKIEVDPRDPLMIKTVRAAGYLFTPDVEVR